MIFKYVGPHDEVDLIGVGTVARDSEVEVSGPVATSLAGQTDWERVDKPKPRNTPATTATTKTED